MNVLVHLLKELKVSAVKEQVIIEPFEGHSDQSSNYQIEIDFEIDNTNK